MRSGQTATKKEVRNSAYGAFFVEGIFSFRILAHFSTPPVHWGLWLFPRPLRCCSQLFQLTSSLLDSRKLFCGLIMSVPFIQDSAKVKKTPLELQFDLIDLHLTPCRFSKSHQILHTDRRWPITSCMKRKWQNSAHSHPLHTPQKTLKWPLWLLGRL